MKRAKAMRREYKLLAKHNAQITRLMAKMSDIANTKSEVMLFERMESSNNKFGLLKEQATEFASKKEVDALTKLVYIGIGMLIVLEVALRFIK